MATFSRQQASENKADYVFQQLKGQIIRQELRSGDIVRTEDLCAQYHVSSSPAREALQRMCSLGVMRAVPRCGFALVRMSERDFREQSDFYLLLMRGAAPLVVERMDEAGTEALMQYHSSRCPEPRQHGYTALAGEKPTLNQTFIRLSGNSLFLRLMRQNDVTRSLAFAQFTANHGVPYAYWVEDQLIEAACARDLPAVLSTLDEVSVHLERAVQKYSEFLLQLELEEADSIR